MTLHIHVSYIDEATGERKRVDLGLGGGLAGFEVARTELWGLPIMEDELGLEMIPSLKYWSIHASGEELDELEHEANIILDNLSFVLSEQKLYGIESLTQRVTNIIKAVAKAREVNGEVNIG
jgi:hypothetical protein